MNRHAADDRPELYRALARMRDATGLPLAFGGEVGSSRQVRLSQIAGPSTGVLRGVTLECGRGLGGKAVKLRRPVVVNDYVRAPAISHHYDHIIVTEGLHAMIAVPVVVQRTVRAVLYGALRSALPLGDRVVQSVLESARDLEQSLYAELRVLTQHVPDPLLRQQVRDVCEKLSTVSEPPPRPDTAPALSARELDVLACVALGWTNAQVAKDLGITMETVKSYLRSAMRKLVARSRMEAVVTARRLGLLP